MLRKSLVFNLAFTAVTTLAVMAMMPSPAGLAASLRSGLASYASNSALLSPFVFRNILK